MFCLGDEPRFNSDKCKVMQLGLNILIRWEYTGRFLGEKGFGGPSATDLKWKSWEFFFSYRHIITWKAHLVQWKRRGWRFSFSTFANTYVAQKIWIILSEIIFFVPCEGEIWDQEFDPVMVILRTVYRRDVQSAMDRYTALWVLILLLTCNILVYICISLSFLGRHSNLEILKEFN